MNRLLFALVLATLLGCRDPVLLSAPAPKHAVCEAARPRTLPAEPTVELASYNAGVDPARVGQGCDAASVPADCSDDPRLACADSARCARIDARLETGVCLPLRDDTPGSALLSYRAGGCLRTLAPPDKARLCCDPLRATQFDCRSWPLDASAARSRPGELCARHDDCEPGLLCGASEGIGRCTCPGVDVAQLDEPVRCDTPSAPGGWGLGQLTLDDTGCAPSLESPEPFRIDRIADVPCRGLSGGLVAGVFHILCADPEAPMDNRVRWFAGSPGDFREVPMDAPFDISGRGVTAFGADQAGVMWGAVLDAEGDVWWLNLQNQAADLVHNQKNALPPLALVVIDGRASFAFFVDDQDEPSKRGLVLAVPAQNNGYDKLLVTPVRPDGLALAHDDQSRAVVLWTAPEAGVSASVRDGAVMTPLTLAGAPAPARALSSAGLDALAFDTDDAEATLRVLTRRPGTLEFDGAYSFPTRDAHFLPDVARSSVAMHDGEAHVAYRAASGIRYARQDEAFFTLAPESEAPLLILDANGSPHVFYSVVTRDAAGLVTGGELRHVRAGSCPEPD